MKFSTVLLVAGAAVVAAQNLADLPDCAKNCASEKLTGTDCGIDPKCICSDKSFLVDIAACVDKACTTTAERDATIKFAVGICKAVNINIDTGLLPAPTSSTSAPSSESTSANVTDTATTTAAPSTVPTGSAGGKNNTISTPKPGSDSDGDEAGSDSAAGRVGGSIIGVVAALAGACLLL